MARTVEKNRADEIFDEPNSLKACEIFGLLELSDRGLY